MELIQAIASNISSTTGNHFQAGKQQSIGGGCINNAFRLDNGSRSYFVKTNSAQRLDMFIAEAAGLQAIANTGTVNVPRPVCHGEADGQSYLVLGYIHLVGRGNAAKLGEKLAAMHGHIKETFGFETHNTIGTTLQENNPDDDWIRFWQDRRLRFQLRLAKRKGCSNYLINRGNKLIESVPCFFKSYKPRASMLHGDLWGGNWSFDNNGEPVIFDPAAYYGDRETDIAMTELFGRPGAAFYDAYNDIWPLDEGYKVRKTLYNLYHVINHFNLFGGGYLRQAESMVDQLLDEI